MSKGIIVVDIPKCCDQCPIRHPGLARCQITGISTSHTSGGKPMDQKKRPKWCPIKPIPDRKPPSTFTPSPMIDHYYTAYDKGWNDCLDKILKEKECG